MKRIIIASFMAALLTASVPAFEQYPDPSVINGIDTNTMSEEQIRIAYDDLKTAYERLYTEHFGHQEYKPQFGDIWAKRYYLDDFGNQTDKAYIINDNNFTGTFSNSATTDARLKAAVYVEPSSVSISLLEYDNSLVRGYYSRGQTFLISVQTQTEGTVEMQGILYQGASGILLGDYSTRFIDLLKTGGELKVFIKDAEDGMPSYLFTIPGSSDFANLYSSTFGG
ncbi:MAG: hypothetical protein IJ123_06435 [Blautia sp.]|nr:hypothetical protein [Blautia sp.]